DLVGGRGRVGLLGAGAQLSWPDQLEVTRTLPDVQLVDLTAAASRLRVIKSPLEVAFLQEMGRLLDQGLTLFEQSACPGRLAWEVAGEVEGFLRGHGCFWGTSKYSFDERPYLYPAPLDRRFGAEDVMVYEFVYSCAPGYWYILSSLYSFRALPEGSARRLGATEEAIREIARVAVPGNTCADIRNTSDRVFKKHGFTITGRHTVDCHPIGTDINDGPDDIPCDWELRENMTLAIHPASLLEGARGYFLCDVFLVRAGGAVTLSPRRSFFRQLAHR
ncbi:MAG: M24 family metallopeptidase, partial [bacterium]